MKTWNDPMAAQFHQFASDVRAANPDGAADADRAWSEFMFWDPKAQNADYKTGPLASLAPGLEMGAVRSSWNTDAVWGSLAAGPYSDFPDAGEQLFDSGSLTVARGNQPFLVNAAGQLFRGTNHPDDLVYADNFGANATRGLFNIFYAGPADQMGQGPRSRAGGAATRMSAFEQNSTFVFMRATNLADMYGRGDSAGPVSGWTRDVTYLRPNLFVVNDRTTVTDPNVTQFLRFHFAGAPNQAPSPSAGVRRYDLGSGSSYAGTVSSVLPAGHTEQVTPNIFAGSDVSRIDVKPGTKASQNQWLTVIDAAGSPASAAVASPLTAADRTVTSGEVAGVVLRSGGGNFAVLSGTGPAGTVVNGTIRYHLPAASTLNVVSDLAPNTSYAVTTTADATGLTVQIASGSGSTTSAAGVLSFTTPTAGR